MRINFDTSDLFDRLDKIAETAGDLIVPAAAAGARVLYTEARTRAPVSLKDHWFYGTHKKYHFKAGTLRDSIYRVYSKDTSKAGERATYHISWNHTKAPYGFMVERGTSRAEAHPFIRPAYDAVKDRALEAARVRFVELFKNKVGV